MAQSFFKKIKETVVSGAQQSANKIEEAARTGKLHIKIIQEKNKLKGLYLKLGRSAYQAIRQDSLSNFSKDSKVIDAIQNIATTLSSIENLESEFESEQSEAIDPQ